MSEDSNCRRNPYSQGPIPTRLIPRHIIPSPIYFKFAYHKAEGLNREELFGHIGNINILNMLHLIKEGCIIRNLKKGSVLPLL